MNPLLRRREGAVFRLITWPRVAALVASLGLFGAVGASALGAPTTLGQCNSGQVCIWQDIDFVGLLASKGAGQGVSNVAVGQGDLASSWSNMTGTGARWYVDANGQGACYSIPANTNNSNMNNQDQLTSWATNGTC